MKLKARGKIGLCFICGNHSRYLNESCFCPKCEEEYNHSLYKEILENEYYDDLSIIEEDEQR